MPTMLKRAAYAGILSSVAIAFVAFPVVTHSANAAMKKKKPAAASSMKKQGGMKSGAAPKGAGKSGDPLNAAAGKKM